MDIENYIGITSNKKSEEINKKINNHSNHYLKNLHFHGNNSQLQGNVRNGDTNNCHQGQQSTRIRGF